MNAATDATRSRHRLSCRHANRPRSLIAASRPFVIIDQPIFFGRGAEAQRLLRLVTMYRGVLLFGDSGCGKSSLLNARFVPAAIADNFLPERIRVQPKVGAEIVVDRIACASAGCHPSSLQICRCAGGRSRRFSPANSCTNRSAVRTSRVIPFSSSTSSKSS